MYVHIFVILLKLILTLLLKYVCKRINTLFCIKIKDIYMQAIIKLSKINKYVKFV